VIWISGIIIMLLFSIVYQSLWGS